MNSRLMSQAKYAQHRGVQKSAVSNWKKAGLLVFAEAETGRLMVDAARSDARVNANVDPTRGRPTTAQTATASAPSAVPSPAPAAASNPAGAGGVAEIAQVRSDLVREQTITRRLANADAAKALVPFAEFEALAAEGGRLARERMHALLRANAERMAAERDPRQLVAFFGAEIDRTFDELAVQIAGGAPPPDDVEILESVEDAEIAAAVDAAPVANEVEDVA